MSVWKRLAGPVLALALCFGQVAAWAPGEEVELEDGLVPLAAAALPTPSGTAVQKNEKAVIDYSNTKDGYVMVQFTAATTKRLKVQVAGPTTAKSPYTYDLPAGAWTTLPLSDGDGSYKVTVFENTTDKKYAVVVSASFSVTLSDEFAPYLRPNQ